MIQLMAPARGRITQRHGARQSHNGLPHAGQDYAYSGGGSITDEVLAAAAGVVVFAGDVRTLGWPNAWHFNPDFDRSDNVDSSAGRAVVIAHNQGGTRFYTTYCHLAAYSVQRGQEVLGGERIATIGDTGFSAGKHLHFELIFQPTNFATATYGRADPNPYFVDSITVMGSSTNQEDDVATPAQMQEMKDFIFLTVGTLFEQYHGVTRAHIIGELGKKIEDSSYEVKAFVHAVDNANADRVILDNRAVEAAQ